MVFIGTSFDERISWSKTRATDSFNELNLAHDETIHQRTK
jgi:hypothetical protein